MTWNRSTYYTKDQRFNPRSMADILSDVIFYYNIVRKYQQRQNRRRTADLYSAYDVDFTDFRI